MQLKKINTKNCLFLAGVTSLSMTFGCSNHYINVYSQPNDALNTNDKLPGPLITEQQKKKTNFVTVVIDDMGWSDCGFLGSEIDTPNLNKYATQGTILTNFYGAASSVPSRAQLFTGKDAHEIGAGTMCGFKVPEVLNQPGYECILEFYTPTLPELLQQGGYHTMFTGKWHLGEDQAHFPISRGFSDTRGVALWGYTMCFANDDGTVIPCVPDKVLKKHNRKSLWNENGKEVTYLSKDFYSTTYFVNQAINMLKDRPKEKPFYINISFNAVHFPLQAPMEITNKYLDMYAKGWDIIRQERFERQKQLGLFPQDAVLPPRDDVKEWDSLNDEEKKIQIKKMAVYAAMVEMVDKNFGRFMQYLKDIGEYENTVVFLFSDNGASHHDPAEDPVFGLVKWIEENFDNSLESIGSKRSFTGLTKGWAMAASTPFNRFKTTMYEGGVHTAAFVHYPKSVMSGKRLNCIVSEMDIAPTILEMAGIKYPEMYRGEKLSALLGVSFADMLKNKSFTPNCDEKRFIGFEFAGIKGIRSGDYKLSMEGGQDDFYMFNLKKDPFESDILNEKEPQKYEEMKEVYKQYTEENNVIFVLPSKKLGGH